MAIDRPGNRLTQTQRGPLTPRGEELRRANEVGDAKVSRAVPSQVDHSHDVGEGPRADIGTQAWPNKDHMELKAMHYRMDMANRHKRPSTQPLMALKQRKLVAKCEFGQQLYTFYEGHGPTCPECGSFMQTISEIGE